MSTKIEKQRQKEAKKLAAEYQAHMDAIKEQMDQLPKPIVRRDIKQNMKPRDVKIDNITMTVGSKILLEEADIDFVWGRKYGLIGKNGIGKSQLLGGLARGEFGGFDGLQVLMVAQEASETESTALQYVLEADEEYIQCIRLQEKLIDELDRIHKLKIEDDQENELANQLSDVQQRLQEIDGDKQKPKAAKLLSGLGFTKDLINRSISSLSGGWKMRVNIARALFVEPDILFLDEPTNHLDLDAVMWLEHYLNHCEHTVIIVSHDREFLNHTTQETILYKDNKLTYYGGNYDNFEQTLAADTINHNRKAERNIQEREEAKQFINKFRANKILASMVQSRIKMLDRMEDLEVIRDDSAYEFKFPEPDQLPPPCLIISEGQFGYNNDILLKDINFGVDMDGKIAIVGPNGAGKSTLLKLLTGELDLTEGLKQKHPKLRISVFTQHHMEQLNLKLTPLEQLQFTFPGEKIEKYRAHLSQFGLHTDIHLRPQYRCSGGQKSRVAFSMFVWNHPHIMILDEPTNHLDIEGVNALIDALNSFKGGVLIVSHDEYLIQSVCKDILVIKDQKVQKFKGDFKDYRKMLQKEAGYY